MTIEEDILPELHRDPELAVRMAANAIVHYVRQIGLEDPKEIQAWVDKVFAVIQSKLTH